ncbi:glycosyltransferase family 4 protein [Syntrophotalea acetylenica]|uniref:Glycosyl transferase group 1 n=1 Tax=Syntrophotalea acetylenica TaxID=29542 RepID=A0A1L3GHX5_SYNAC|nr:glycosyltransferase family 4 protein [Syntrophotalea acetylenica]APG25500.1 hypothetical protein A7E75_11065 [Syntrophotalea acetylenica]
MRVLHYVKQFSPLSETFVYNQIIDLQSGGIENFVVTHKRVNAEGRPFAPVFELSEKKSFFYREMQRFLRKHGYYKYALSTKVWKEILQKFAPDVIHCHFGKSGFYVSSILDKLKIDLPLLIAFHGTDVLKTPFEDTSYKSQIQRTSLKKKVAFTTPTLFLKNLAVSNFGIQPDKIVVNPNGFRCDFNGFYRVRKNDGHSSFKIINIARFTAWKGQDYLIKAFREFSGRVDCDVALTLVGYGERKPALLQLINDLGLQDKVTVLESVPHESIPAILKEHDLYVQPSITDHKTKQAESFGVSILEAVAVGLPVIVTDSGGMQEVVLGGDQATAIVVEEKNCRALCEAMTRVYACGRNIDLVLRSRILERYNQPNNTAAVVRMYESLLQDG